MKLLVTGGNTAICLKVVKKLQAKNHKVVVLTTSTKKYDFKTVQGDVFDYEDVRRAAKGCKQIIHFNFENDGLESWKEQYRQIVEGVATVFQVARDEKIQKIIFLSSLATKSKTHINFVKATKMAEEIAKAHWQRVTVPILRVPLIYNKEFIKEIQKASKLLVPKISVRFYPLYEETLVDCIVGAIKKGKSEIYNCRDQTSLLFYEFIKAINYPKKTWFLPELFVKPFLKLFKLSKYVFEDKVYTTDVEKLGVKPQDTISNIFKIKFKENYKENLKDFKN